MPLSLFAGPRKVAGGWRLWSTYLWKEPSLQPILERSLSAGPRKVLGGGLATDLWKEPSLCPIMERSLTADPWKVAMGQPGVTYLWKGPPHAPLQR